MTEYHLNSMTLTEFINNHGQLSKDKSYLSFSTNMKQKFELIDTQKNRIFMLILNIKVSSNLVLLLKSYEPRKIILNLEIRGKYPLKVIESLWKSHHRIQRIRESCCWSFNLQSTKMWNFVFCQKIDHRCALICLFLHGWSYRHSGPRMSREGSF